MSQQDGITLEGVRLIFLGLRETAVRVIERLRELEGLAEEEIEQWQLASDIADTAAWLVGSASYSIGADVVERVQVQLEILQETLCEIGLEAAA
jgi:hypothetical protein